MSIDAHLSRVNRVVHYLDPTLECGHLEQAQVRLADVVKVHRGIEPRVVLGNAGVDIGDYFVAQGCVILIDALRGWKMHINV